MWANPGARFFIHMDQSERKILKCGAFWALSVQLNDTLIDVLFILSFSSKTTAIINFCDLFKIQGDWFIDWRGGSGRDLISRHAVGKFS